jgi:hypothetical protein
MASESRDYNFDTCFPWRLLQETIEILRDRGCTFVTPSTLVEGRSTSAAQIESFGREYVEWLRGQGRARLVGLISPKWLRRIRSRLNRSDTGWVVASFAGLASRLPPVIALRHDADRQPYKTTAVMQFEARHGVVSSAYFFRERNVWDDDLEPYVLNVEELKRLERVGFEIGYHLNAFERANYELERAKELVDQDVTWLAQHFNLRSFTPHGGVAGPNGLNNHKMPKEGVLTKLLWAGTGGGLWFDAHWSDGYIERDAVDDPREFARRLRPGTRAMMLFHPQYIGDRLSKKWLSKPIAQQRWWRDCWEQEGWPMWDSDSANGPGISK